MKTSINEIDALTTSEKTSRCIERIKERVQVLGRADLALQCLWADVVFSHHLNDQDVAYKMTNPVCVALAGIIG